MWRIVRTAQPPLTRLMSPMSEVAISILCQDQSDSVRSQFDIPKALKANVKVAHLNVWSLQSRENFCLVKDTILHNGFDIFTVSETWAHLFVSDTSLEISGYQLSDRIVDNIKLEEACAPTPSQRSRLLCLRIYHLPATMASNNFG